MLSRFFDLAVIKRKLLFKKGATMVVTSASNVETTLDMAELAALNDIAAADLAKIDGITNGTVAASKAAVVDANKDISAFRDVTVRKLIGSTAPLNVDGLAAAQGGAVTITGGASSTSGNAGGAVNLTGGAPGATGVGGGVNITGGTPVDAAGGAIVISGSAGVGTNRAGGLASVTGGASTGSATGGVASLVGGAAGAATGVGGGVVITSGIGNTTGASGSVVISAAAGGNDAVGGLVSLTGGLAGGGNRAGGEASLVGGAGAGTAAGGAALVTGGLAGATNGVGGAATVKAGAGQGTGAGAVATIIGGASGAGATGNGGATAVTGGAAVSTNGQGGDVTLTPGVGTGTGFAGNIVEASALKLVKQAAPTALTTSATLTAAQLLVGLLTSNQGAAGAASYTLPTGTAFEAGFSSFATDQAFDFSLINISTNAAEDADILTAAGWTLVGSMAVQSNDAITSKSVGRFRARRTAANTYTLYRIG